MASHDPTAEALVPRAEPRRTVVVLAAAVVSGIAGYLVLVLTARHLDAAENADFLVFWAALFSVFGVLVGIASETTRAVFAGESEATPSGGVRVVPVVAAIGVATAVVLGVSGLWWGSHLFGDALDRPAARVAGRVWCCSPCTAGSPARSRAVSEWDRYAALVAAEPTVRVLAVAWSPSSAPPSSGSPRPARSRPAPGCSSCWSAEVPAGDVCPGGRGLGPCLARVLSACSAAAASALLLVGFPVLLRATTPDAEFATAAPLILAVSLSRAPLLVPLGAYQTVAVTKVMTGGLRTLLTPDAGGGRRHPGGRAAGLPPWPGRAEPAQPRLRDRGRRLQPARGRGRPGRPADAERSCEPGAGAPHGLRRRLGRRHGGDHGDPRSSRVDGDADGRGPPRRAARRHPDPPVRRGVDRLPPL